MSRPPAGRCSRPGGALGPDGFSLVSALFLLVAISTAGAFLVRVSGVQRTTTSLGLLGAKAFHAARSAIEWNLHRALTLPGSCPGGAPTTSAFTLAEGGLAGFSVTVTCQSEAHVEAGASSTFYRLTALAEWGSFGDRDYVSRRLETRFSDGP